MCPQIIHAFLLTAAIILALDDAYLLSAIFAAFPVAWMISRRRESLKRLGAKLMSPFPAAVGLCTAYFFLLDDVVGVSMMRDRISPLPRYVLPAILAILPATYIIKHWRLKRTAKA